MFLEAGYINKNTPELRSKLEELGYKCDDEGTETSDVYPYLAFDNGYYYSASQCKTLEGHVFVDCNDREDFFIAVASLRDDTDKNQWFVNHKGEWLFCMTDNIKDAEIIPDDYLANEELISEFHKADVLDLMIHFVNFK